MFAFIFSDYFTMNIAGVVYAQQGQKISLHVYSSANNEWQVSQDSSLSIALVNSDNGFLSGMLLMLDDGFSQKTSVSSSLTWKTILHWSKRTNNVLPGNFITGEN